MFEIVVDHIIDHVIIHIVSHIEETHTESQKKMSPRQTYTKRRVRVLFMSKF